MTLLEAIAHIEGFYSTHPPLPNRPQRNNNPGDIRWGRFAQGHGATHGDHPDPLIAMAVFPSADAGFAALKALLLAPAYAALTIQQAIQRYAPPVENDTDHYLAFVMKEVGCLQTALVSQVLRD